MKKTSKKIPKLGVIFFSGINNDDNSDLYSHIINVSKFADKNNFNSIWIPERHFTEVGGQFPNPSVLAAAISTITEKIRIRAGSVNLPLHDPLRVIEEWSVVDNLSNGRVDLAVAPGWHIKDYILQPDNFEMKNEIFKNYCKSLTSLWEGNKISRKDSNNNKISIETFPKPIQKELPLWLTTSRREESWDYAGRMGYNILTALINFNSKELERRIKIYKKARKESGFDEESGQISLLLHTYIGKSKEEALKEVEIPLKNYLKLFLFQHQSSDTNSNKRVEVLNTIEDIDEEDFIELVYTRYIKGSSLIGDVTDVKKSLEYYKNIGVDEISCLTDFGIDNEKIMNSLELLSTVMEE